MISSTGHLDAYIWIVLPGAAEPVVCGRVSADGTGPDAVYRFVYGRSYRERDEAIPLTPHELPLSGETQPSRRGLHGVLRDAAPDAWGRRVFQYRLKLEPGLADDELTELDYPLAMGVGSGALGYSESPDIVPEVRGQAAPIEELLDAAEALEKNEWLTPELADALLHGTSIGGARPKALVADEAGTPAIAKFGSTLDHYAVVRHEALGLALARAAGVDTVEARLQEVMERDVLLVPRFDRNPVRHMFSALTALELDEMEARYASYPALADYLRKYATDAVDACAELYRRMVLNILIGNTDDHARNHAMFWDGNGIGLAPAYDIVVTPRIGQEAGQAMGVGERGAESTLANALTSCGRFGIDRAHALSLIEGIEGAIRANWQQACDEACLDRMTAERLMGTAVLSPAATRR